VLLDALTDPDANRQLMDVVARQRRFEGQRDAIEGRRFSGFDRRRDTDQDPHPLRAEQSNSSVLFGDRSLMKVIRRLEPGVSPDVELGAFLSGVEHVPELLGTLDVVSEHAAEPRTLATVQRFVANEGDAWSHTLDELDRFAERVAADADADVRPSPRATADPVELAVKGVPEAVYEGIGPYLGSVRLLGQRTAELHIALGSDPAHPDLAPEAMTRLSQRSLYQSVRNAVRIGLRSAKREARTLEDPDQRAEVEALITREDEILERLRALSAEPIEATRIRTHGDYHLGQVLFTGRDFVIIDLEGEPARPLGERRLKRSPLRDVAGMLRSLQYATAANHREQIERGLVTPGQPNEAILAAWLEWWLDWTSAAFLEGYLATAGDQPFVPDDRDHVRVLLDAFVLEKAVYELGYEMNNRPEWVGIPLSGITQVFDRHER
jgi:maltose alpha-D-glucosyltransferase / alpha-amylase